MLYMQVIKHFYETLMRVAAGVVGSVDFLWDKLSRNPSIADPVIIKCTVYALLTLELRQFCVFSKQIKLESAFRHLMVVYLACYWLTCPDYQELLFSELLV